MDKSWITSLDRTSMEFMKGLNDFLDFAFSNKSANAKIRCPCRICKNSKYHMRQDVYEHVIVKGFMTSYTNWLYHGEEPWYLKQGQNTSVTHESNNFQEVHELIHENFGIFNTESMTHDTTNVDAEGDEHLQNMDMDTEEFFKMLKAAECELYPGCKNFTLLSFIIDMLHVKCISQWSNSSFTILLSKLKKAFPENDLFPTTYREAWKIVKDLGLEYKKFHACPNDCMLYRNETENEMSCKTCKEPRYKQSKGENNDFNQRDSKVPQKVVRYFPLKPRLQRMYMSSKTARLMRWHEEERVKDGMLRHPADSLAWKDFDNKHPNFASDCRNVRLGLASDGFNPFKSMSISHSTWPVIVIPYNLPPWRCMKQPSFMLSLLIDGPRGPGNDIDVYLQPLIDELNELWETGVPTYDAHAKQMFNLRAALFWTINDFPAYANLSGWSTKGLYACPCCNKNTRSNWLKHGKKYCYLGHRRFLPNDHRFRRMRAAFDGKVETDLKPIRLSGNEILKQLDGIDNHFGKGEAQMKVKKRKRGSTQDVGSSSKDFFNWKKVSIFFQLPYWKENLINHNLDIMHVEKNVLENILFTILGVKGKSKDNVHTRYDLQHMKIRKELHPQVRGDKVYLPPACFTMSNQEKDIFLKVLKNVKVPDGYASNISRCVHLKERTISGLKSHDCHILLHQLLPIAIRRTLPKNVCKSLMDLGDIFKQLYSKVHNPLEIEALQDRVALTLCELEKIFPPSFFDIMEHLPIHLVEEAIIAGPPQWRSMYPIERYLGTLKNYVRSRSRPEGSIAEGYLAEECMTFCSMYLDNEGSKLARPSRNYEDSSKEIGRVLGKAKLCQIDDVSWVQAHRYVLANTESVSPFYSEHLNLLKNERPRISNYERERLHNETFHTWFKSHVSQMEQSSTWRNKHKDIADLAAGPNKWVRRFSGYIINGFRFHTKERERRRKTQNSGVFVDASTYSFSSTKDKNPVSTNVTFFGVLTDIIELRYSNDLKYVMFKCDWVDNGTGCKQDEYNFTLVNFAHLLYKQNKRTDEPFILASQAMQSWYVQDPIDPYWYVAVKMTPRPIYNVGPNVLSTSDIDDDHSADIQYRGQQSTEQFNTDDGDWVRGGVEGATVDVPFYVPENTSQSYSSDSDNSQIRVTLSDSEDNSFDDAGEGDDDFVDEDDDQFSNEDHDENNASTDHDDT